MTTLADLVWPATPCWSSRVTADAVFREMCGSVSAATLRRDASDGSLAPGAIPDAAALAPVQRGAWRAYAAEVARMNAHATLVLAPPPALVSL